MTRATRSTTRDSRLIDRGARSHFAEEDDDNEVSYYYSIATRKITSRIA